MTCIINLNDLSDGMLLDTITGWVLMSEEVSGSDYINNLSEAMKEFVNPGNNEFQGYGSNIWESLANIITSEFEAYGVPFPFANKGDAEVLAEMLEKWKNGDEVHIPELDKTTNVIQNKEATGEATEAYDNRFMIKAYGVAQAALQRATAHSQLGLVSSLLANRGYISNQQGFTNKMIGSNEIDSYVKQYQEQLFKDLCAYLIEDVLSKFNEVTKAKYSEVLPALRGTLYKVNTDGTVTYTGAFEQIKNIFKDHFNSITEEKLINATDNSNLINNIRLLNAYEAWTLLNNFDSSIRLLFGDAILINDELSNFNKFVGGKKYNVSTKADQMNKSWRVNEEYFLDQEVSRLNQRLIETTPIYNDDGTIVPDKYLKFQDFVSVVSEVKNLAYDPNASRLTAEDILRFEGLADSTKRYIQGLIEKERGGVTLRTIVTSLVENAQQGAAAIFDILANPAIWNNDVVIKGAIKNNNLQHIINSIHYGITSNDGNKSLHGIRTRKQAEGTNYYSYVTELMTSIFKNNFLQAYYDKDSDTYYVRTLYEQSVAEKERLLRANISSINGYQNLANYLQLAQEFEIEYNFDNNNRYGIRFTIPLHLDEYNEPIIRITADKYGVIPTGGIEIKQDRSDLEWKLFDLENANFGREGNQNTLLEALLQPKSLVESILNLNMIKNKEFFDYYLQDIVAFNENGRQRQAFENLIKLTTQVLVNRRHSGEAMWEKDVTQQLYANENQSEDAILDKLAKIQLLGVSLNRGTHEMELFFSNGYNNEIFNITKDLAIAKSKAEGLGRSSQSKDATNKSVSNTTLSRLIGSVTSQMDIQCKTQDSASKDFDIVNNPDLLMGFYKFHEVSALDGAKRTTQFNDAELNTASFVLNFLDGLSDTDQKRKNYPIGNGKVGLLASVNSDKSFIDFMLVNLNATIKLNGIDRTYKSLNNQEIKQLIANKIGNAYKLVLEHVQEDYNKLFDFGYKLGSNEANAGNSNYAWLNDLISYQHTQAILNDPELSQVYRNFLNATQISSSEWANKFASDPEHNVFADGKLFKDWIAHQNKSVQKAYENKNIGKITANYASEIGEILNSDDTITPAKHGFAELREWLSDYNERNNSKLKLEDLIKQLCLDYNMQHRLDPIELVDNIHMNKNMDSNETLLALINRFSNARNSEEFWQVKQAELVKGLLSDGFEYTLDMNKSSSQLLLAEDGGKWVDYKNNKMILAKLVLTSPNGMQETFDLTSRADLKTLSLRLGTQINTAYDLNALGNLIVNPLLEKWNLFDYYFTQQHLLTSVGSHIAHPSKGYKPGKVTSFNKKFTLLDNQLAEEAARFFAQHKRNVSLTAAMHEFQLNLIDGIPAMYNIATIKDIKDTLYNLVGKLDDGIKPFDGATFVHPVIVRLENNSLGAEKAGNSKKQFVHFYNQRNMNGGIIKTCGFGITNALVRDNTEGNVMANMLKKMMWNKWISDSGEEVRDGKFYKNGNIVGNADFTVDLFGNSLTDGQNRKYADIYYYNTKSTEKPTYWKRVFDTTSTSYNVNGTEYMAMTNNDGSYTFNDILVDEEGNAIMDKNGQYIINTVANVKVDSNWTAYTELFKGQYCYDISPREFQDNKLHYSETSLDNLTTLVNNMGYIRSTTTTDVFGNESIIEKSPEDVEIQDDVWQPAKHSDIHYLVTEGAIKQGSANTNSESQYYDNSLLNFQRIHANQIGIQLDKEHHADSEELSIMNQVIQACSERGFSEEKAHQLYRTLFTLTKLGLKTQLDAFRKLTTTETVTPEFAKTIELIVKKAILNSGPKDGNLVNNLAADIEKQLKANPNVQLIDLDAKIPFSEASLFSKLNAIVASFINRSGIKQKLDGVLSVLNPSYRIKRTYNGHLIDYYRPEVSTNITIVDAQRGQIEISVPDALLKEQELIPDLIDFKNPNSSSNWAAKVTTGAYYLIDGVSTYIRTPNDYKAVKRRIHNGEIKSIKEHVIRGRELSHYNVVFNDTEGNTYNIYDLDSSSLLFNIHPLISALKEAKNIEAISDILNGKQFVKNGKVLLKEGEATDILDEIKNSEIGSILGDVEGLYRLIQTNDIYKTSIRSQATSIWNNYNLSSFGKYLQLLTLTHQNNPQEAERIYFDFRQKLLGSDVLLRRLVQRDLKAVTHEEKVNPLNQELLNRLNQMLTSFNEERDGITKLQIKDPHELDRQFSELHKRYIAELNSVLQENDPVLKSRGDVYKEGTFADISIKKEISTLLNNRNNYVKVNGKGVTVDKDSIIIKPYEVVMPQIYRSTLKLGSADDINSIIKDNQFFYKRALKGWTSKTSHFDFEFKSLNGNNYYVLNKSNLQLHPQLKKKEIFKSLDREDNHFMRISPNGKDLFEMYTDAKNGDDEIWTDGDVEIIVTNNPEFYRDTLNYNTINLNFEGNGDSLGSFIASSLKSDRKAARNWARALTKNNDELKSLIKVFDKTNKHYSAQKQAAVNLTNLKELIQQEVSNNEEYWNQRLEHLKKESIEMHTSLLKTLGIVAARIPAQSQQSFMPMQVVAYDTVDVNSAYVSTAQIWLQGSDYKLYWLQSFTNL